jgi:hypothetical protein
LVERQASLMLLLVTESAFVAEAYLTDSSVVKAT